MNPLPLIVVGLSVASLFTGCATAPENIPPAYVSHMSYMQYSLEQLGQEEARLQAALATSSDAQRKARSNDTIGVIFLGLPVSSLSGSNQAANVARLKGELEAVQKAMTLKGGKPSDVAVSAGGSSSQAASSSQGSAQK